MGGIMLELNKNNICPHVMIEKIQWWKQQWHKSDGGSKDFLHQFRISWIKCFMNNKRGK